jgi:hypothetical protein
MKNIFKIILGLMVFTGLSSCESLIEEKVNTNLDAGNLYSSESGCEAALNGVYAGFLGHFYYGNHFSEATCNLCGIYTRSTTAIDNSFANSASTPYFTNIWQVLWQQMSRTNDVIYNVSQSDINENVKNKILGEAYLIRAKIYFDLVRMWGAVPLRLSPVGQNDINIPRTPVNEIYQQVIADLDLAKNLLPEPANQEKGRPHKYAAYALAQRVYLSLAGNDEGSLYWKKSVDEGLVVYKSGDYKLVRPFSDLWDIKKQNSTESIFEMQGSVKASQSSLTRVFLPTGPASSLTPLGDTWARAKVNKEVYDKHVKQYPKDPRIDATYLDSSYVNRLNSQNVVKIYPLQKTGAKSYTFIRKYVDPDFLGIASNCNYIYLRYADVLLMLAEAENELNGPNGAYKYINEVINRARDRNGNGLTDPGEVQPADWSGMTKDEFRERILSERNYELLGELHEYFDVRRRGKEYFKKVLEYHNTYPANITANDYKVSTDDATMERIMLLPIPISELSTNTLITVADQNSGY